jgi:3-polyprenyl-4-hydroxybenzoate decarboxylase
VLFENVSGPSRRARVAGNLLSSRRRLAARALGTTEDWLRPTPQRSAPGHAARAPAEAPVQEVVHRQPADVGALLPLLTHHAGDGAPFSPAAWCCARDPATGHARHGHPSHDGTRAATRFGILLANPPLSLSSPMPKRRASRWTVAVALGVEPAC